MKRKLSFILAVVMILAMATPAFADVVEEYGVSVTFGEPGGIGVQSKDKWGYDSYIKNNDYKNVSVKSLSECPKMDYVKTIEGVTFSNYIRHTERNSTDAAGNPIKIYYVYIGLDGAMRATKGSVEFMTNPGIPFNDLNENVKGVRGSYSHACSDLNMYKTNTAYLASTRLFDGKNGLTYLYDIGITPYTNGERNMDGTWNEGLTWVFGRCDDLGKKSNGTYGAAYPIRVNYGDTAIYFGVAVTDATNYSGDRNYKEPSAPVTPSAPAENVTAVPNKSAVYINNCLTEFEAYTINQNNYFKLRDIALVLRGTEKQFNVTWNGEVGAIDMKSHTGYIPVGGEMSRGNGLTKQGILNKSPLFKDGKQVEVTGYTINQNNFFKLRDLGELFDFNVSWDGNRNSIVINTAESYDPTN